jgi:hypothetical protein
MENVTGFWQGLNWRETIDIALDLVSGPIYEPQPVVDDLCSPLFTLPRSRLGFAGRLAVPEARCIIVWGQYEFCHIFRPGIHSLRTCPPGPLFGQLIDMSQRSLTISLSDLHTADLAQLSLQIDVEFKVDDPRSIVLIKAPLQMLSRTVESTMRQVIGGLPHHVLLGSANPSQLINRTTLERQIRLSLLAESILKGLRILSIKIVRIEGDPAYLTLMAQVALAKQQFLAEEAALLDSQQLAHHERELTLFRAETERLATCTREESAVDDARRKATIFELGDAHREFQRQEENMRMAHERTMARIHALGKALAALGNPNYLAVANATYAQAGYSNGHDPLLTQLVSNLMEAEPIDTPARSNGRTSH